MALLRTAALAAGMAAVAVLLVAAPASAQSGGLEGPEDPTKEGVEYRWWNEEWHMRVPVLVRPQMPDAVVDGRRPVLEEAEEVPVHAEIDFTEVIRQVGDSPDRKWPQKVDGSLNSFTFDKDSVRVVRYDRDTGTIVPQDDTGDVVPSRFLPTLLERRNLRNDRFDPSSNAVGTVTWIAEGTLDSPRLYFVYFDILENGDKPPPEFTPEQRGALDSLHWIRPGTDAYGYAPEPGGRDRVVEVYGLHPDTAVRFSRYSRSGFAPEPVDSCDREATGLCIQGGRRLDDTEEPTFELEPLTDSVAARRLRAVSSGGGGFFFHVQADKPVLVAVRSLPAAEGEDTPAQLFYPGTEGLVSHDFEFTMLQGPASGFIENLDVRLVAPQSASTVEWTLLDRNGRSVAGSPFNVPAHGAVEVDLPTEVAGEAMRVEASGGPVSIAKPGYRFLVGTQAPTPHGAPVGEATFGPAFEDVRITPWENATEASIFDLENPGDEDAQLSGVGGPGPAKDVHLRLGRDEEQHRGNVFWASSQDEGPLSTLHGDTGIVPLGGKDGRSFQVPMGEDATDPEHPGESKRLVLFPTFDRTHLRVTQNATGSVAFDGTANQHRFLDKQRGEILFPAPGGYEVEASKPILAYLVSDAPNGKFNSYYPTVSRSPLYEVGEADFHGHLVRWQEPLRTPTLAPGQENVFKLDVTNLGRRIGGEELADDVKIEQEVSGGLARNTSEQLVRLSTQRVTGLGTFDSREVRVSVAIPEEASTGDELVVNLTAISQGNPNFRAFTQLKITVETLFRVELTFRDNDCNPKTCERLVDSGSSTLYAIEVNNTGTGDDSYRFSVSESQSGFSAQIQRPDGSILATPGDSKGTLAVARGDSKLVFLNVTAPDDVSVSFPYEAVVQATSQNDNKRDQVTALTRLSVNTDFRLEVLDDTRPITPGENATFPIRAVNEGDDTVLEVSTSDPSLEGWNVSVDPSSFLIRANGTTAPDGTPGDVRRVDVNVTASDDARVGEILPLEVSARPGASTGSGSVRTAEVRAVVENNFTLATSGLQPRSLKPGESFRYEFSVRNAANGPFSVTVNATGLPDGWRFEKETPTEPAELAVGGSLDVAGDLVLPPGTPAGRYNVTFTLFGETAGGGRGVQNTTGVIQVARRANLAVEAPADLIPVPPGNRTRVPLNVTNAGNVDLDADLSLDAPSGWTAKFRNRSQRRLPLDSGESRTVDVVLHAPGEIGSDPVPWSLTADLPLRSSQTFDFRADWVRRDLVVTRAEAVTGTLDPGSVGVVAVTVRNDGNLPANNVGLAVLDGGSPVSNVTVETLPPGEDRVVQVQWTVGDSQDDLQVVVDPSNGFVETDEGNNVRSFSPTSESAVPGPSTLAAAAVAAALAAARRRWRR